MDVGVLAALLVLLDLVLDRQALTLGPGAQVVVVDLDLETKASGGIVGHSFPTSSADVVVVFAGSFALDQKLASQPSQHLVGHLLHRG